MLEVLQACRAQLVRPVGPVVSVCHLRLALGLPRSAVVAGLVGLSRPPSRAAAVGPGLVGPGRPVLLLVALVASQLRLPTGLAVKV